MSKPRFRPIRCRRWFSRSTVAIVAFLIVGGSVFVRLAHADAWALLIGINQYEDAGDISNLDGADNDALALAKTLIEVSGLPSDHVTVLTSSSDRKPLKRTILHELEALKHRVHPGDTVFIAYSGHGVESEGVPYLLPYDADMTAAELTRSTSISEEMFRDYLKNIPARALILVFDMCRVNADKSGKSGTVEDAHLSDAQVRAVDFSSVVMSKPPDAVKISDRPEIVAEFFACSQNGRSYEWKEKRRGYFSYFLEQGLRGQAGSAGLGTGVSLDALQRYLATAVPAAVREHELGRVQTPTSAIVGPLDAGDFILTRTRTDLPTVPPITIVDTLARIAVTVNTPKAKIFLDGTPIIQGKEIVIDLGIDRTKIVEVGVKADGYRTKVAAVTVGRGSVIPVNIELEKDPSAATTDLHPAVARADVPLAQPQNAAAWVKLGIELGQKQDFKGSIEAFTQYIALKPADHDFVEAYKNRGIAYYNMQDWKDAQADLTEYNTAKPGDKDVSRLLAQAIQNGGGDAIPAFLAVVRRAPGISDPDAWFNLGVAYLDKKDNGNAVAAFTKSNALKAEPKALFNRALAYYNLGQAGNAAAYAKAEADCGMALALNPEYADAVLLKADSEYAEKKPAAALDYGKYLSMPGSSAENKPYAQRRILQSYLDNKNFSGVITATSSLIASDPAEPQNYFIRGTAYVVLKNFDSAIPDLMKYTGMNGDNEQGFYNLGLAYQGKADHPNAAASFEKASSIKPDMYDAASQAATEYKRMADGDQANAANATTEYDKAVGLYDKASTLTTATPKQQADALYNEANALEAKVKALDDLAPLKTAITIWNKWVTLSPTDPELPKIKQHIVDLQAKVAAES